MYHVHEHDIKYYQEIAFKNDQQSKARMKQQADKNNKAKPHEFQINDYVYIHLNKERKIKSNKFDSTVDTQLYQIVDVNGTMVTAIDLRTQKKITRNACFFQLARNIDPIQVNPQKSIPIIFVRNHNSLNESTSDDNSHREPEFLSFIEQNHDSDTDESDSTYSPPNREPVSIEYSSDTVTDPEMETLEDSQTTVIQNRQTSTS